MTLLAPETWNPKVQWEHSGVGCDGLGSQSGQPWGPVGCYGAAHSTSTKANGENISRKENNRAWRAGKGVLGSQCHSPAKRVSGKSLWRTILWWRGKGKKWREGSETIVKSIKKYSSMPIFRSTGNAQRAQCRGKLRHLVVRFHGGMTPDSR